MTTEEFQLLMKMMLEMADKQDRIHEISIRNSVVLEEHARRSTASEERLEVQERKLEASLSNLDERFNPIEDHIKFVGWVLKGGVSLITLAGIIVGIVEFLRTL